MITRFGALALVALLSAPLLACDRPGDKEQNAEGRANLQAQEARDDAARKAAAAQAEADQKIALARIELEKTRDDYRASRQGDVANLNKKLADLEAKDKTATGQTRADLDVKLPFVRAQRDAFVADMKSLDSATAATWDDTKDRLDKEWDGLKASADQL